MLFSAHPNIHYRTLLLYLYRYSQKLQTETGIAIMRAV